MTPPAVLSRALVLLLGLARLSAAVPPRPARLEEDRTGAARALWIERIGARDVLVLGRAAGGRLLREEIIATPEGTPGSPDIDFDALDRPWIAWAEDRGGPPKIMVREPSTGRTRDVGIPSLRSVSRVRVLAGSLSEAWIFWTGREDGRDGTFSRRYDGRAWSRAVRLDEPGPFPRILMDAASGPDGRPWVVWAEYDGNDYEVLVRRREGPAWSAAEALTDDPGSDAWPGLAFLRSGHPVVVWSHVDGSGTSLRARVLADGAWGPVRVLLDPPERVSRPSVSASRGDLRISWTGGSGGRTMILSEDALRDGRFPVPEPRDRDRREPGRDENGYIAFGDETTYGWIDAGPAAELGYVPRLETLLTSAYGPSTVANEGMPGETTVNGLGRMADVLARNAGRYLLLMEGANDAVAPDLSLDATAFNLEQMVLKCAAAGVLPLLASLTPRNDAYGADPFFRKRLEDINEEAGRIALNLRLPFVDIYNAFLDYPASDGGWPALLSDPAHPNERGYEVIAGAWAASAGTIPFPPESVTARRTTERSLLSERRINYLTWRHSPKIRNPFLYRSYRIYRKDADGPGAAYALIAVLPYSPFHDPQRYNDLDIAEGRRYRYAVSLVDVGGIEGPLSDPADDSEL